jgi:hypothetical protein
VGPLWPNYLPRDPSLKGSITSVLPYWGPGFQHMILCWTSNTQSLVLDMLLEDGPWLSAFLSAGAESPGLTIHLVQNTFWEVIPDPWLSGGSLRPSLIAAQLLTPPNHASFSSSIHIDAGSPRRAWGSSFWEAGSDKRRLDCANTELTWICDVLYISEAAWFIAPKLHRLLTNMADSWVLVCPQCSHTDLNF